MVVHITGKSRNLACFLLGLLVLSPWVYSQEGRSAARSIPDALLRPERGEAPRYPKDVVIGELGQGKSPGEAYLLAKKILSVLTAGTKDAPLVAEYRTILTESLREEINNIEPRNYRIGGGRVEADGSISFLVRFIGPEESISGELFLRREEIKKESIPEENEAEPSSEEGKWFLDDLVLEEKRALTEIRDSYRYDFSPYERFY